jgi:MFS family permease
MPLALTSRRTQLLIASLTLLVGVLALCADRVHNGDVYLELLSGRFIVNHGLIGHDPFHTIAHGQAWLNQQWLSELAFYGVVKQFGLTGLTVLYAALIAAPLALLLWLCRRKGLVAMIAVTVLYFPGLLAVIHPRSAGFTVLAFSLLIVIVAGVWRGGLMPQFAARRSLRWALVGIGLLFALWANLHGGFIAGLLLLALTAAGLLADRWCKWPGAIERRQIALLGIGGLLGLVVVSFATPLGDEIWAYLSSFRNPALSLASKEWGSAFQSTPAVIYLIASAGFAGWLWLRMPKPRPLTPLIVSAGFLLFGAVSVRNIIFVAPVLALQIFWTSPDRRARIPLIPIATAATAAAIAAFAWVFLLGPAKDESHLSSPAVAFALRHPPQHGRIATYAGVGSYLLWRTPTTRVVIDGWIEHFSAAELRGNYGILRGWADNPSRSVRDLHVGAVIAHLPGAIRDLEEHGFVAKYADHHDTYLVRRGDCCA